MGTAPYSATDWWKESQKPLEIAMTSGYHLVMTFTVRELENPWPINGGLLRWEDHLFRLWPWRHHGYVSHNQRVILSIMVPSFFKNSLGSLSEKGGEILPQAENHLRSDFPQKVNWFHLPQADYGVDFYISGHTHLQNASSFEGTPFVISGGGGGITSVTWRGWEAARRLWKDGGDMFKAPKKR